MKQAFDLESEDVNTEAKGCDEADGGAIEEDLDKGINSQSEDDAGKGHDKGKLQVDSESESNNSGDASGYESEYEITSRKKAKEPRVDAKSNETVLKQAIKSSASANRPSSAKPALPANPPVPDKKRKEIRKEDVPKKRAKIESVPSLSEDEDD